MKSEDNATGARASTSHDGEGSLGLHQRETYCLLVRVTHNVDSVSLLDSMVPTHVWSKLMAQDICTYQLWIPTVIFNVELLSDTEFLLFQDPCSGKGMTWENIIEYIQNLHRIADWGGTEVNMVSGQHTMKQVKFDLANTQEYHQAHTLEQLATA